MYNRFHLIEPNLMEWKPDTCVCIYCFLIDSKIHLFRNSNYLNWQLCLVFRIKKRKVLWSGVRLVRLCNDFSTLSREGQKAVEMLVDLRQGINQRDCGSWSVQTLMYVDTEVQKHTVKHNVKHKMFNHWKNCSVQYNRNIHLSLISSGQNN